MSTVAWGDIFTLPLRGDRIMEIRHTLGRALSLDCVHGYNSHEEGVSDAQCERGGTKEPAQQVSYVRQSRRRSGDPRPQSAGCETGTVFGRKGRRPGDEAACRWEAAPPATSAECTGTLSDF